MKLVFIVVSKKIMNWFFVIRNIPTSHIPLTTRYIDVLLCLAATKVVICQILAVCILGWIQDRNITEAIDLGTALLEPAAQWTQDTLLVQHVTDVCLFLYSTTTVHDS